jgi:hypothetical protein
MSQVRLKKNTAVVLVLLLSLSSLALGQGVECPPGCGPGRWSSQAVDLASEKVKAPYKARDIRVYAPDRQKSVHVLKDHWWVEVGEKKISPPLKASTVLYPAELTWAPDSRAFFITHSIGYSTGYHTEIYRLTDNGLLQIALDATIKKDFDRHHKCFDGQVGNDANVAGLKWLDGSDQLLVIAEVPPLGICKEEEYFGGYEISVGSGQIMGRFSPQQLADRWSAVLGERLKSNLSFLSASARATVP